MKVTLLGGGAVALTYAAMLIENGHDVVLWSETAGAADQPVLHFEGPVTYAGPIAHANSLAQAVAHGDVLLCARSAKGVQQLVDRIAPLVEPRHTLILSAELGLSSAYADRMFRQAGKQLPIVSWSTTAATARRIADDRIRCGTIRNRIDYAVTSARQPDDSAAVLAALFPAEFHRLPNAMAVALSNLNPPIHLANTLANLTRIENAEAWDNYANITPAVGRVIEALDLERLALAARLGLQVRTVFDHYLMTFPGISAGSVSEMAWQVHKDGPPVPGPKSLDTRYLSEDVPFGLVPLMRIATQVGVEMPLHHAGLQLASVYAGRDFAAANGMLGVITENLDLPGNATEPSTAPAP